MFCYLCGVAIDDRIYSCDVLYSVCFLLYYSVHNEGLHFKDVCLIDMYVTQGLFKITLAGKIHKKPMY